MNLCASVDLWLKTRRQQLDQIQAALTRRLRHSKDHVQMLERRLRRPSEKVARLLASVLGIMQLTRQGRPTFRLPRAPPRVAGEADH
jgi:ribosome-binding protein aMBF1 (putative translation factor)